MRERAGRRVVSAFIATAFAQETPEAASTQWRSVADQIRPKVPKLAHLMDQCRERCAGLHDFSQAALGQAPLDQSHRASKRRDQTTHRGRRHLSQRGCHHPSCRRSAARTEYSLVFGKRAEQVEQKRAVRIRGVDRPSEIARRHHVSSNPRRCGSSGRVNGLTDLSSRRPGHRLRAIRRDMPSGPAVITRSGSPVPK